MSPSMTPSHSRSRSAFLAALKASQILAAPSENKRRVQTVRGLSTNEKRPLGILLANTTHEIPVAPLQYRLYRSGLARIHTNIPYSCNPNQGRIRRKVLCGYNLLLSRVRVDTLVCRHTCSRLARPKHDCFRWGRTRPPTFMAQLRIQGFGDSACPPRHTNLDKR